METPEAEGIHPGYAAGMTPKPPEQQHRTITGNALRAAVLGANDGLVSNLNLVMGVAGAGLASHAIVITGIAGLLAGAISMALGEWISVQSARELAKRELAIEAREIDTQPDVEQAELVGFFLAKGLAEEDARHMAARMMTSKEAVLDTMAREELGIDPKELGGSAWVAAYSSFLLFVLGASIPLLPYFFATGQTAIAVSVVGSAIGLVVLGAGIGWLNGLNLWYAAGRQLLFGLVAGAITYGLGKVMGAVIQ
ncbi:MAG: hypothetical protein JWM80_3898 [Cyanobacteria bacterium RYN_339]|nr:hypothetical protein [Cyanobacteria bacterium RYN_339]